MNAKGPSKFRLLAFHALFLSILSQSSPAQQDTIHIPFAGYVSIRYNLAYSYSYPMISATRIAVTVGGGTTADTSVIARLNLKLAI